MREMDLTYEVKGLVPETVEISLRKRLIISSDLDREVDTASHTFGYYAVLAEKAKSRHQKLKFAFDTKLAEWEGLISKEREYAKQKALGEAKMRASIRNQFRGQFQAFQLKLIEYDEHARVLTVIAKAFEMKSSLVQTKSRNRRRET